MILKGDCIEVMKAIKPNSVDAIVTDPPYGLEFMGRSWDKADVVKDHRFCAWLAGFADGESNFDIHRQIRNGKEYYYCRFEITLREDDSAILELIKKRIGGKVYYHSNKCRLELVAKSECMQLVSIFEQFPLQAKKKRDFEIWKKALKISVDNHGISRPDLMKPFWLKLRSLRKSEGIDNNNKDFDYGGDFHYRWLTEAYRVLKPGGSMLVMGGTRTSHRLACAIEDSGFIIKDTLMYLYGSGFPKAQDLGKMIDKRAGKERTEFETRPIAYPDSDCWSIPNKNSKQPQWGIGNKEKHKNQDGKGNVIISKPVTDLAKHWDGFKVGGIKPAYEPIVWAVKPPQGSYVDNVLKWGVGAVNVDECRISHDEFIRIKKKQYNSSLKNPKCVQAGRYKDTTELKPSGRFPANVILSHHPECVQVGMKKVSGGPWGRGKSQSKTKSWKQSNEIRQINNSQYTDKDGYEQVESWNCHPDCAVRMLDEQSGVLKSGARKGQISKPATNVYGEYKGKPLNCESSSGGASRFFKQCNYGQEEWLCHENCALRQLDEQSGNGKSPNTYKRKADGINRFSYSKGMGELSGKESLNYGDNGGASRFFYCAKASRGERNAGLEGMENKPIALNTGNAHNVATLGRETKYQNNHPTVKPIKLFEWLIKLVTREGQIILEPFIGSGTTAIAAHNVGRKCIGIEKEKEYLEIAKRRVAHWRSRPRQLEMI